MDITKLTADDYENIAFKHDFQKEAMSKALEITKQHIRQNSLILVGGMAIDFALRTKGKKLYPDDKYPDYDFYSTEFHRDAYRIGEKISKDYDGVSIISAFHASTMKVRLNFQEVADITYIPKEIFKRIPTIIYQGINIVHPHFQMIDQHRALSLPFEKPPLETMYGRWKKDICRYDLLNDNFPIEAPAIKKEKTTSYKIPLRDLQHHCLDGYPALLYWIEKANQLLDKKITHYLGNFTIDNHVMFNLHSKCEFNILSDKPDDIIAKLNSSKSNITSYNPVLDKIPERTILQNQKKTFCILNNNGDMRSAHKTEHGFHVANLQQVMCYLLTRGIFYKDNFALSCYKLAQQVLFNAVASYEKTANKKFLPFLPSGEVYGQCNTYDSYCIAKNTIDATMYKGKKLYNTPPNAYPKLGEKVPEKYYEFDPTTEHMYQFDGEVIEKN